MALKDCVSAFWFGGYLLRGAPGIDNGSAIRLLRNPIISRYPTLVITMDMPFGSVRQLGRSGDSGPHTLRFSAGTHVEMGRIQVSNRAEYRAAAHHCNRSPRLSASILAILSFLARG